MFREGVSDRDITYAFSFELERRMGACSLCKTRYGTALPLTGQKRNLPATIWTNFTGRDVPLVE